MKASILESNYSNEEIERLNKSIFYNNDFWFNEKAGEYKGFYYIIRYNMKGIRCIQVLFDYPDNVIESENVYIDIEIKKNFKDSSYILIFDNYYDNSDIDLTDMPNEELNNIYRPFDYIHIGTCEYYEDLAKEFIESYLVIL